MQTQLCYRISLYRTDHPSPGALRCYEMTLSVFIAPTIFMPSLLTSLPHMLPPHLPHLPASVPTSWVCTGPSSLTCTEHHSSNCLSLLSEHCFHHYLTIPSNTAKSPALKRKPSRHQIFLQLPIHFSGSLQFNFKSRLTLAFTSSPQPLRWVSIPPLHQYP